MGGCYLLKYNGGDSGIKISVLYWRCSLIRVSVIRGSILLCINPGDQRGRGRLKSRWIDGVEEDARKLGCRNWLTSAQDRNRWLHLLVECKVHLGLWSR
jgi:hypothetical protein